jgi:hypothetical protein
LGWYRDPHAAQRFALKADAMARPALGDVMSNDLECGCEDECMHKPDCVFERKKPAVMSEQGESFEITWRNGAYYVSIPNYRGGEVYTAEYVASLRAQLASVSERVAEMQYEAGMYHSLYDVATERLASARKALEGVYDHMDRNGMANWPVAKRVRKELDSLTDEEGNS